MNKREVEVFITDCPLCKSIVETINSLACGNCSVTYYDVAKLKDNNLLLSKINDYKINRIPSVVVNGKLLNCRESTTITEKALVKAGIGK